MADTQKIICTLGPSSMNESTIKRLEELGVSLVRLNLSHTPLEELEGKIDFIQRNTEVPLCLDSEGAQVRTGTMKNGEIKLCENHLVSISKNQILGTEEKFNIYPHNCWSMLIEGDVLRLDFDNALIRIEKVEKGQVLARILVGGVVGSNKGIGLSRPIELDPLTEKDMAAFEIGKKKGVVNYALSFAQNAKSVERVRSMIPERSHLISKIESTLGYENKELICEVSDAVLIDRGDLSRDVPLELIPIAQKEIIKAANELGKPAYVATNLLESMRNSLSPTRAEVSDIYNTLLDGASGLVLAAETAIGFHPVASVKMLKKVISVYRNRNIVKVIKSVCENEPFSSALSTEECKEIIEGRGWLWVGSVISVFLGEKREIAVNKSIDELRGKLSVDGFIVNGRMSEINSEKGVLYNFWNESEISTIEELLTGIEKRIEYGCTHCLIEIHGNENQADAFIEDFTVHIEKIPIKLILKKYNKGEHKVTVKADK